MRTFVTTLLLTSLFAASATAQDQGSGDEFAARVWLDRGDEPVLQRGERVRVYYRTSHDAFTAIFRIDTDGLVSLVHPAHPGATEITAGGQDYRLLFPDAAQWRVYDDEGVGYFFIIASQNPLDLSAFRYVPEQDRWDLGEVGSRVYEDPYLAIDDFVAAMIPNWEVEPYTLDFFSYSVGERHEYPRFLCYNCHENRSFNSWNPYTYACTSFRVVVWDDPYYYPAYRYSGTRVVFTVPFRNRPRYTVVTRKPGEGWSTIVRTRAAPPVPSRMARFKEPGVATGADRRTPVRRPVNAKPSRAEQPRRTSQPVRRSAASGDGSRTAGVPSSSTSTRRAVPRSQASTNTGSPSRTRASAPRRPTSTSQSVRPTTSSRPSLLRRLSDAVQDAAGRRSTTRARPSTTRAAPSTRSNPRASRGSSASSGSGSGARSRTTIVRPSSRSAPDRARTPSRPQTSRATPSRSRPAATPSRARPTPRASTSRPSASRPSASRPSTSRPTVRARPTRTPPRRGGRGG